MLFRSRILFAYMYAQPAKKLLFMGGEFGQWAEWSHDSSLEWHLLEYESHRGLQKLVADARAGLEAMKPTEVNALEGKDVSFQFRDTKLPFVAEAFLLSFSLPNFHFHATTAYDILRSKGVPVGKRDYMGRLRLKG